MQQKVSQAEFIEIFKSTGGRVSEVAKIIGTAERTVHKRRRSIESRTGQMLRSESSHSPDYGVVVDEFPDWQQLQIKNGLIVAFSDSHLFPNTKTTAHRALLKLIKELKPKAVIDMGDLLDFGSISRHHRIGWDRQITVKKEIEWAGTCLREIKSLGRFHTARVMGNHDQRFSGFLSNNIGQFEGVKGFSLQEHLQGWPVSWSIRVNDDQLEITHRWKGGIHATHNNTLNSGISYATGHLHSQKVSPYTDLSGDRWGVDVGTLASIYGPHFRYLEGKPRNWRSGFAVFRFVNGILREPQLVRVLDEKRGIVEFRGQDINV
jgi:hypothetical protein